jgi:hypothetical protein
VSFRGAKAKKVTDVSNSELCSAIVLGSTIDPFHEMFNDAVLTFFFNVPQPLVGPEFETDLRLLAKPAGSI